MKRYFWIIVFIGALLILSVGLCLLAVDQVGNDANPLPEDRVAPPDTTVFETDAFPDTSATPTPTVTMTVTPTPSTIEESGLTEPVTEFKQRITLKPFGIYITPETSPVQPERFAGYHNAVDVEFTDRDDEIPVYAIADGTVIVSRTASGYGGLTIIRHEIEGESIDTMYAHLDPNSLPRKGSEVVAGEQIGHLGEGNTAETDFERKHLHFGMHNSDTLDIRGYVQSESELANWYDPLIFY